jgi:hypothetical protein
MNAPTSAATDEKSVPVKSSAAEEEISSLVEQEYPKRPSKIEHDAERIKSSVLRLASNSINELEGLTSELHALQEFLKSETERVQREIDSALAGIKIIIETLSPWRSNLAATARKEPVNLPRGFRPTGAGGSRMFEQNGSPSSP